MSYSFNGEKLKKARVYNGFTATQLASLVGCTDRSIKMYESGKIKNPESEILKKLSYHLGFPESYFFGENIIVKDTPTHFRSLLTTPKRYRDEQIERIEIIAILFSFISEYINFDKPILPDINEDTTPEDAATRLRTLWGIGAKPVEHINFLVEQYGIIVTSFRMSTDKIDAFSRSIDNMHLIGYTSNKDSAARIHFDVAHELGHICLHSGLYEDMESLKEDR
ncbi:MAG: XRE family transcriptional regulator, partial [Defluviitaleaceae bacterium]|nr:XRE family transcriptional regulator [Defluviitaleaceae bacterium]